MSYYAVVSAVVGLVCVGPQPVLAQSTGSGRAYRGLFGGDSDVNSRHKLDVSLTVAEAFDDNLLADAGSGISPTATPVSGFYTMFLTDASYGWQGRRLQVAASAGSAWRYYQSQSTGDASHTAAIGLSAQFASRTSLSVNQTAAYSPSYLYGLFPSVTVPAPGDVVPVAPDYAIDDFESFSYGTSATISHGLTRRGTLTGTADFGYTDFLSNSPARRDSSTYHLEGAFAQGVSRNAALKVGYRYQSGDVGYGVGTKTTEHGIDIGVDYSKPLSATRKATFGVTLGSSLVDVPDVGAVGLLPGQQFRMIGGLRFSYAFNRTWQARATYERGLDYVAQLTEPVFSDGVSAVVEGLLSPRLVFDAASGYSTGESAIYTNASAYDTYTATARVRYALTRKWSTYVEYLYYYYDFRGTTQLPPGVASNMERNGVRGGITLWVPVFRK